MFQSCFLRPHTHKQTGRKNTKPNCSPMFPRKLARNISRFGCKSVRKRIHRPLPPHHDSSTIAILPFCQLQASQRARKVRRPPYHINDWKNLQHGHHPYRHHSRCDRSDTSRPPPWASQRRSREWSQSRSPEIHGMSVCFQSLVFLIIGQNFT